MPRFPEWPILTESERRRVDDAADEAVRAGSLLELASVLAALESFEGVTRRGEVTGLPLHPGLAATWPWLHRALDPLTLVVDAANVVGSTPDGWWRDRAGAARRLLADLAGLVARGVPDAEMPDGLDRAPLRHWWPRVVVVLEGAARPAADAAPGSLDVVAAAGSGDDAVVEALRDRPGGPVVVVTADRALGERCRAEGATVAGPRWLRGLLGAGAG
jgi:hypothetical protein